MSKGLCENLPYPSLEGITPDAVSARIISPAYAADKSEMTAVLQYIFQHIVFDKLGNEQDSETLLAISISEMEHLDLLGETLIRLGATPIFTAQPPYPINYYSSSAVSYSTTPQRMILDDISAEKEAIACYEYMLTKLCNQQVANLIARIILDEKLHLKTFEEIYNRLISECH